MTEGFYVMRIKEGEMPEYFFGRNYKWLKEPTEGCIYKKHIRASKALEKCIKTYSDGESKFAIVPINEVEWHGNT